MVQSIQVVSVPVSDQDKAKAFYEQLGFETTMDGPWGDGSRWVQLGLSDGSASISLVTWFEQMPAG